MHYERKRKSAVVNAFKDVKTDAEDSMSTSVVKMRTNLRDDFIVAVKVGQWLKQGRVQQP